MRNLSVIARHCGRFRFNPSIARDRFRRGVSTQQHSSALSAAIQYSPLLYSHDATRSFATKARTTTNKSSKKKKKGPGGARAVDGRILAVQSSKVSKSKDGNSRLCVGCGVQVMQGGRSGGKSETVGMIGGEQAVSHETNLSKKQQKKLSFVDVAESNASFLCDRCKALKSDNVFKAYDALYDVSPEVFAKQLQHIVGRRRFGLCLLIVDSTDPEHSAMNNLRRCIGKVPCLLVFTKIDLVPRMTHRDRRALLRKITQSTRAKFVDTFGVSSVTGRGIFELAESILGQLQGRDVFVIGCANVGKSTLVQRLARILAESAFMKGKRGRRRRDVASNLAVTGSHLPGTTLQAVRIPCFSKSGHALWDTPGIINRKAIQYGVLPVHLMEPLAQARAIPIPTKENGLEGHLHPGDTLLIEADWMQETEDEEPCVLGRLDLVDVTRGKNVFSRAFLHPSLRVRVVPTENAPDHATIPTSFIQQVNKRMKNTKLKDEYSLPLKPFVTKDLPEGKIIPRETEWSSSAESYFMDISFASLGWISFAHNDKFSVIPHCVEGSVFSKRPALYPMNLRDYEGEDQEKDHLDEDTILRRLQDAARQGRHQKNRIYSSNKGRIDDTDDWLDDDWY